MKNYIIPLLAIGGIMLGYIFFTEKENQSPMTYAERIEDQRLEKEYFMRADPESPFKSAAIPFEGLNYFPPNEKYKVKASVRLIQDINTIELPTSDGKLRKYFKYALLTFSIDGQTHNLTLFKSAKAGENELFLAFKDLTNGESTYGAGRYLDVNHSGQESLLLDFNLAYNPYCAYNPEYSCPFPPRENRLSISIPTGEKIYKEINSIPEAIN